MKQEEITEGKILMKRFTHDHFNPGEHSSDWLFNLEKEDAVKAILFYYTEVAPNLSFKEVMEFLVKLESFEHNGYHYRTVVGFGNYCGIMQAIEKAVLDKWESSHVVHEKRSSYTWTPDTKLEAIFIAIVKFIKWFNETYKPNT
jgi:hypothetical protein